MRRRAALPRRARGRRRGRESRGPLGPAAIPVALTRSAAFDASVLAALDRLQQAYPELDEIDVVVADAPPGARRDGSPDPVRLGGISPAMRGRGASITVYRRPIELRAAPGDARDELLADVITELVAELLGLAPAVVDGEYSVGRPGSSGRHQ